MSSRASIALGCDLGATNLRVAAVQPDGKLLSSIRRKLEDRAPEVVADELAEGAEEVLRIVGASLEDVRAVGVGVAGQVLGRSGLVLVGPNLGWRDVAFGDLVEARFSRHVRVVNDLSAAAWGEASVGAAQGATDVLLVFAGSGVGGGMILDGRLYEGPGGLAGEIGHVKVVRGGRPCGCGQNGCLEAYAGGHNIATRVRELAAQGKAQAIVRAAGGVEERLGGPALEAAAEAGDPEATAIREEIASYLGIAIANAVTLLNPQQFILGGGVLMGMAGLKASVLAWISRAGGPEQVARMSIHDPSLGDDAGVIGAALLALGGASA
ncbi:MAG TPA: ROK family protein [Vulgatibacter sp.]|nr:ROK family protein [Vulgatibacter sp.]